jgi:hypothetical protein
MTESEIRLQMRPKMEQRVAGRTIRPSLSDVIAESQRLTYFMDERDRIHSEQDFIIRTAEENKSNADANWGKQSAKLQRTVDAFTENDAVPWLFFDRGLDY